MRIKNLFVKFHDFLLWFKKFHDFSTTLSILSQNSMTFPEIPENFKIPENPWLFHDRGNPVLFGKAGGYSLNICQNMWMHILTAVIGLENPYEEYLKQRLFLHKTRVIPLT